jgi:hypothetical protein
MDHIKNKSFCHLIEHVFSDIEQYQINFFERQFRVKIKQKLKS